MSVCASLRDHGILAAAFLAPSLCPGGETGGSSIKQGRAVAVWVCLRGLLDWPPPKWAHLVKPPPNILKPRGLPSPHDSTQTRGCIRVLLCSDDGRGLLLALGGKVGAHVTPPPSDPQRDGSSASLSRPRMLSRLSSIKQEGTPWPVRVGSASRDSGVT